MRHLKDFGTASIPVLGGEERKESCAHSDAGSASTADSQTAAFESFQQWHEHQGTVKGRTAAENARLPVLAYHFAVALGLRAWPACRVTLLCVRLLAACRFALEDVEVCLAMSLSTLRAAQSRQLMSSMGPQERALVAMLYVYCAHSLVFDEFIHFNIWHEWLLSPFCSLKTSSSALKKVCALRKWRFVVPADQLKGPLEEVRSGPRAAGPHEDDSDYEGSLPGDLSDFE
jgi:hypothetical protein